MLIAVGVVGVSVIVGSIGRVVSFVVVVVIASGVAGPPVEEMCNGVEAIARSRAPPQRAAAGMG